MSRRVREWKRLVGLLVLLNPALLWGQSDYHWPVEGTPAITSTFCSYRDGYFHAGIDVKTRGRVGLKAYAVASGYVWRVQVSPYGYGKAVYLKLDDGRLAVYGHLSDFIPAIGKLVKTAQQRNRRYRVNLFLKPNQIRVERGQVIAYTGRTATVGPHLHFELRDRNNVPINALLNGLEIRDTRSPYIKAISITPLDPLSRVNGSAEVQVLPVDWDPQRGLYVPAKPVSLAGRIGFGVAAYDRTSDAPNVVYPYAVELYWDGKQQFASHYTRFSYDQTHQIYLDRDYRLAVEGAGIFQRLFRAVGNKLPFYEPYKVGDGIVDTEALDGDNPRIAGGFHEVRMEVYDVYGNRAAAVLKVLVDRAPQITQLTLSEEEDAGSLSADRHLHITGQVVDLDDRVETITIEVSGDRGKTWRQVAQAEPIDGTHFSARLLRPARLPLLVRVKASDSWGLSSAYRSMAYARASASHQRSPGDVTAPTLKLTRTHLRDYLVFHINASEPLRTAPQLTVQQSGGAPLTVALEERSSRHYEGVYPIQAGRDGPVQVIARGMDLAGNEGMTQSAFKLHTISPQQGGKLALDEAGIWIQFAPGDVYETLAIAVEPVGGPAEFIPGLERISTVFALEPASIPFNGSPSLSIAFSQEDAMDFRKIGLYRLVQNQAEGTTKWAYVGGRAGPAQGKQERQGIISGSIGTLSRYAVLKDLIPPRIYKVRPGRGNKLKQRRPTLTAMIEDEGSGVTDLGIELYLDGELMISEWDPPRKTVRYPVERPLAVGQHILSLVVTDNAGNSSRVEHPFEILP